MKKTIVALASLLACSVSHAASVTCSGRTLDYVFTVRAKTSGTRVAGRATVIATKSGAPLNKGNLPIVSSRYVPRQRLAFLAQGGPNRVAVEAMYSQGNQYTGSLSLSGQEGSTSVAAVCVVR